MLSFAFFTLTVSYLVSLFGFDPNVLRIIAVVILIVLGCMMIFPPLARLLETVVSKLSGRVGQTGNLKPGFWGGFITGLSLGIVWTPCAGPILAAIATLAATNRVNSGIILVTLVYVIGIGIPLFLFSYGGQKLVARTRLVSRFTGRIQQVFGVILLLTAIAIGTNYDKVLQAKLLDAFPSYSDFILKLENKPQVKQELDKLLGKNPKAADTSQLSGLFNAQTKASEFVGITTWLNLPENKQQLSIEELKGKVVLVDFWTYTCINCIRTLPYVTKWYDTYKDKGFVVIGVHTPEFAFEKETRNVETAIAQFGIKYPVAQDNNYQTWEAFANQYWPAKYLIDAKGVIRKTHFGEGKYKEMEMAIQQLLKEQGAMISTTSPNTSEEQTPRGLLTPETYLGTSRLARFANEENISGDKQYFYRPPYLPLHSLALSGDWTMQPEYAIPEKNATLEISFYAGKVFLVMTPTGNDPGATGTDEVTVLLDDHLLGSEIAGKDVKNSRVQFDTPRLYELVDFHGKKGSFTLKLTFLQAGTKLFAFTFGE